MNDFFNTKLEDTVVYTVTPPSVVQPKYLDPRVITLDVVYQRDSGFGPVIYYEPATFRSDEVTAVMKIRNGKNDGYATNISLKSGLMLVTDLLYDMVLEAIGWK